MPYSCNLPCALLFHSQGVINETAIMLTGFGPMGRFGHSIINLGDVNGDNLAGENYFEINCYSN